MPGSSNSSSFIPKRGTKKSTRKLRNINIYILTIVSYGLFFAALGASAFAYFYTQSYTNKLNTEITTMSAAVSNFKEADMQRVQEFDVRLRQANQRLNHSASVVSILSAIESTTIDTVRLNSLSLQRNFDNNFVVEAEVDTDSFDSTIFQRDIIEGYDVVEAVEIQDVSLLRQGTAQSGQISGQTISFQVHLAIPLSAVPYEAVKSVAPAPATPEATPATEQSSEVAEPASSSVDNQEDNI